MIVAVILAAGKGTRFKSNGENKTASRVSGKALVTYGAELFEQAEKTYVVVGAFAESVREALKNYDVRYVEQSDQLGTGHAAQVAVDAMQKDALSPHIVLLGYGDHLMCYTKEIVRAIIGEHQRKNAAITLVTVHLDNPDEFRWGRIVRAADGTVERIVEQKDANEKERAITECNAGFYVFDYAFLRDTVHKLSLSPVTGECYVTDLVELAVKQKLPVVPFPVPYQYVGSGVNTHEQLIDTEKLLKLST